MNPWEIAREDKALCHALRGRAEGEAAARIEALLAEVAAAHAAGQAMMRLAAAELKSVISDDMSLLDTQALQNLLTAEYNRGRSDAHSWQPEVTAPDGERVLMYHPIFGQKIVLVAKGHTGSFTHWMPLPLSPVTEL